MKYAYYLCSVILSVVFVVGTIVIPASALEDVTLPSETVVLSVTEPDQTEVVEDPAADIGTDSDNLIALADVSSDGFDNLAYYSVSSSLGDLTLYLPEGIGLDTLQLKDGSLYNTSNSTIYLYCPEYSSYTFSAARFSPVMFRSTNYDSTQLTGVTINDSSSTFALSSDVIIIFCLVLICFFLIWRH